MQESSGLIPESVNIEVVVANYSPPLRQYHTSGRVVQFQCVADGHCEQVIRFGYERSISKDCCFVFMKEIIVAVFTDLRRILF